jgi:hypothetical protein
LNPLKLAGQCGKLKCCLNYELDNYVSELKLFPDTNIKLKTVKGQAFYRKMDIFKNMMWYSYQDEPLKFIELKLNRVNEIIELNKKGEKPNDLMDYVEMATVIKEPDYANVVGQDSLTRFDRPKNKKHKKKKKFKKRNHNPNANKNRNKNVNNNK